MIILFLSLKFKPTIVAYLWDFLTLSTLVHVELELLPVPWLQQIKR
jgi:hypothetical protein